VKYHKNNLDKINLYGAVTNYDIHRDCFFNYNGIKLFQVYSLGNGQFGSNINVFNIYNVGYTGATFANKVTGTFKRVIDPEIILETKSKYYVREHKILTNVGDCVMTKNAFEKKGHDEFNDFIALTANLYLDILHSMIKVKKDTSSKMEIDSQWSSQIVNSINENVKKLKKKYNFLTTKQYLFINN
jgi:hypothetical protein